MIKVAKQQFIRETAALGRISWSDHAIGRLVDDDLVKDEVVVALQTCEVIEDYPILTRPLPDCLVLGWLPDRRPVHVVVAINEPMGYILIVTNYRPTLEKWEDDYRTRKRQP